MISAEALRGAFRAPGFEVPWTMRRANLEVGGIDLRGSVGARLTIGNLVLEITEENPPCRVMDIQQGGLRKALMPDWRGGVACHVLYGAVAAADELEGLLKVRKESAQPAA